MAQSHIWEVGVYPVRESCIQAEEMLYAKGQPVKDPFYGNIDPFTIRAGQDLTFPQSWNFRVVSGAHTQLRPSTHICHICPITCFSFVSDSGHPYHHCHDESLIHGLLAEPLLFYSGLSISEFSIPMHPFPMDLHFLRHFGKIFLNSW